MQLVDLWAMVALGVAGSALALRANMLKPHKTAWAPAPWPVWVGLMALAIALGMAAITIGPRDHATPREAMIYSVLAVVAVVMVVNLHRNGREAAALAVRLRGRVGIITSIERTPDRVAASIFRAASARANPKWSRS